MPSAKDLAHLLIQTFREDRTIPLTHALTDLLQQQGQDRFEAAEEAEKIAPRVRNLLEKQQEIPFEFGAQDPMLLVGKRRVRVDDNLQTGFARLARACVVPLHQALCNCADYDFEVVCAAALFESGALPIVATCSGDDGGIDLYGRLPLRPADANIQQGILQTTVLPKELLLLGQCKRFDQAAHIGRPEIQKFVGAVHDCLNFYEGNPSPPSRRVPVDFYQRSEICIPVFVTTAEYAETAIGEARGNNVVLINGRELAQFLVAHQVGTIEHDGQPTFDLNRFNSWLEDARRRHQRTP
jgi:hypothetical protein